jgi:hypothetical protein
MCSGRVDANHDRPEQVQKLIAAGAQLVEVLPPEEYDDERTEVARLPRSPPRRQLEESRLPTAA